MSEWKPYFSGRKRYDHPSGFVVIMPTDYQCPMPIFCPICQLAFRSSEDLVYWETYACCSKCGMKWVDPNRQRWTSGWRPTLDEIAAEVKTRKDIPLIVDLSAFELGCV
jgi:hypothetical protein